MSSLVRVTGTWTSLITDWLDYEQLPAPDLRAALGRWAPEDAVPMAVWRDMLARAVTLLPSSAATALAIGARVQPRYIGVLGYLVLASTTLGEAMQAYQRYERLFYGADLAEVSVEGNQAEMRWQTDRESFGLLHDSVAIASLVTFLRRQIDQTPPPTLVSFVNPAPADPCEHAAYEAFFGCPVRFDDSHTRVRFPLVYLSIPMPHSDPGLRTLLDRQAQALLLALPGSDSFDRALQQSLLRLLPDARASLPDAARELHMSSRTLQRRLLMRGMSWQQLLDCTREELAKQYLADRALTLGDIALLLGFSEQSAFNRAFRRWTGLTPDHVRRSGVRSA